jgi:hypothetical protein
VASAEPAASEEGSTHLVSIGEYGGDMPIFPLQGDMGVDDVRHQ